MDLNFLESNIKNPQVYALEQNFTFSEETDYFENLLNNFVNNWQEIQHRNWIKFWERESQTILETTWYEKYADYALDENLDDLWQSHSLAEYSAQWTIYEQVFYNYFISTKASLEHQEPIETTVNELELKNEAADLIDDFEQLKLLGLPTKFGVRQQQKKTNNKRRTNLLKDLDLNDLTGTDSSDMGSEDETSQKVVASNVHSPATLHKLQDGNISKKKTKKLNRKLRNLPSFMQEEKSMIKYWRKRFSLFSRFDEGILLDRESWFSVTPEKIAADLAQQLACDLIVDGFCGCGGNTIQFAKTCKRVIAVDIDAEKLAMAKHNAQIYGVAHKIDFILGDFLKLCSSGRLQAVNTVFLSPPWGGPKYKHKKSFDIERFLQPVGATELFNLARNLSGNIAFYLPRNSSMPQVIKLAGVGNKCLVKHSFLDTRPVAITAFYGKDIIQQQDSTNDDTT